MVVTKYNLKNSSKNKTSKIRRVRGGLGASSFGEYAFGSAGMQTSVDGTSNLISTNPADKYMANPDTYAEKMVVDGVVGGGKITNGGRGILTDVAIPAVLLYANNTIGKKKNRKSSKSKKYRKTIKKKTRFSRKKN
jgi:hypothetical protein